MNTPDEQLKMERREKFRRSRIYPVISSEFCMGRPPDDIVREAVRGGAKVIQIREKNMPFSEFAALAIRCRRITASAGVLLIIDDNVGIAAECQADGVHVGQDDLPPAEVRRRLPDIIVGKSTHNAAELLAAQAEGVDYVNIGPIFPTATKSLPHPAVGLDGLAQIIPLITIPFSVMGGIKSRHLPRLAAMGVHHAAMVTEITMADDVFARTRSLSQLLP